MKCHKKTQFLDRTTMSALKGTNRETKIGPQNNLTWNAGSRHCMLTIFLSIHPFSSQNPSDLDPSTQSSLHNLKGVSCRPFLKKSPSLGYFCGESSANQMNLVYFIKWKKNKGTVIKAKTTWNKSSPKSVQKIMKQRISIQTDEWSQVIALCCLMKDNVPFCSKKGSIVLSTTWSPLAAKVGRGHRTIDTHRSAKTYKQKKKMNLDLKKEWGAS